MIQSVWNGIIDDLNKINTYLPNLKDNLKVFEDLYDLCAII